jgi:hypothetical protein
MERTSLLGVVVCALDAQNPEEVLSFLPLFHRMRAETPQKAPFSNRTNGEVLKRETLERKPFDFPRLIRQTVPELQRVMQLEGFLMSHAPGPA